MTRNLKNYGPWAIVTGASSGIGTGFARKLAAEGLNVVLVARRADALAAVSAELEAAGTGTRIVVQDLAQPDAALAIMEAVDDLDVGLLVSNAGVGYMGGFLQNRLEDLRTSLGVNVIAQMELTHRFATRLRRTDRKGGIVLVGSTAGLQPVALGANYSGAKSYVLNLGESLNAELRPIGIDVSVVVPGPTDTPALNARTDIDLSQMPMPTMSVAAVVSEAFAALTRHEPSRVAGRLNRWMARLTPRGLGGKMFGFMMRNKAPQRLLAEAPLALESPPEMRALG